MSIRALLQAACLAAFALAIPLQQCTAAELVLPRIKHFVIIYLENRSFDHLFGNFPGANNRTNTSPEAVTQVDKSGHAYDLLPDVIVNYEGQAPHPDPRFPKALPNAPFAIGDYVKPAEATGDLIHNFYNCQRQIDEGRMDKFVAWSNAGALTFGYYDMSSSQLWRLAREFTLADNFYQAAFGGSLLNHQWLIAARTPFYADAPSQLKTTLDADGNVVKENRLTADGYVVNTMLPTQGPTDPASHDRVPVQDYATIGDRLSDKHISWAWYSGGWNDAVAGKPDKTFQYHHQPFVYFKNYGEGQPGRAHLKDLADLKKAIRNNTLPAVAFYKPLGKLNQHSGYSNIADADAHVGQMVKALRAGKQWRHMAIIITYDEFGGYWDHVAPPKFDRWGPGPRIPAIIVSPRAKKGYIDSTLYDTTSILATLERHFGLNPLSDRDAKANDLRKAFRD
jgi:phospholipase C